MKNRDTLAKKVIFHIVVFSSLVTLLTTGYQLFREYQQKLKEVSYDLRNVEASFVQPLTSAIWFIDRLQIKKQLDGISKIPNVAKVTLASNDLGVMVIDNKVEANGEEQTITIKQNDRLLGELKIVTTKSYIQKTIFDKSLNILFFNSFKTFLVALYALFIFNKLITDPLSELVKDSAKMTIEQRAFFKNLKPNSQEEDELDMVNRAIHEMQSNFHESYQKLKNAENRFKDIAALNLAGLFETDTHLNYSLVHISDDDQRIKSFVFENGKLLDLPLDKDQKMHLLTQKTIKDLSIKIADQHYSLTLKPFFDNKGYGFEGYRGTIINVTEKIKIKEKIIEQEEQIKQIQKIETIAMMTSGLSHDLNNLLSIINTSLQLIKLDNINSETKEKCLKNAEGAVTKSAIILRKIMDFSRQQTQAPALFQLSNLLEGIKTNLEESVGKNIEIIFDFDSIYKVKIDKNLFETSMINLALNSKDAIAALGTITISLRDELVQEHKEIPNGRYAKLIFKDNGQGISPDYIDKIFEPFFTTKDLGTAAGLGLSTVINFVKTSESFIEVESTIGQGTSFILYFPRSLEA